jgi:hypothetical protein
MTDNYEVMALNATPSNLTTPLPPFHLRYTMAQFYETFMPGAFIFIRIVFVLWVVIGLPGNALSAKIWLERRMRHRNSSAIYVAALSINCVVFLVCHLITQLSVQHVVNLYRYPVVCEVFNALFFVPQYLTQLLVLGFTVDRYIAVCHPLHRAELCRTSRAVKVNE